MRHKSLFAIVILVLGIALGTAASATATVCTDNCQLSYLGCVKSGNLLCDLARLKCLKECGKSVAFGLAFSGAATVTLPASGPAGNVIFEADGFAFRCAAHHEAWCLSKLAAGDTVVVAGRLPPADQDPVCPAIYGLDDIKLLAPDVVAPVPVPGDGDR